MSINIDERRLLVVLGDAVSAGIAATIAVAMWGFVIAPGRTGLTTGRAGWILVLTAGWLLAAVATGSYEISNLHRAGAPWSALGGAAALFLGFYLALYFFSPRQLLPRLVVLIFVAAAVAIVATWRRFWFWLCKHPSLRQPLIVVGAGRMGRQLAELLSSRPESGCEVLGFVDDDPEKRNVDFSANGNSSSTTPVFGPTSCLPELVDSLGAMEVALAMRNQPGPELMKAVLQCHEKGIAVRHGADLYETFTGRLPLWQVGDNWSAVLPLSHPGTRAVYLGLKRIIDVVGGTVGLLGFGLLFPFIAAAIKLDSRGPLMYRQLRTGRYGTPFGIWKLRTMSTDAEGDGRAVWACVADPRVTRVGRVLRRMRLDEAPQFWNVLKGEMSLVGPRPERPDIERELDQLMPFYRLRLAVKPGMAGWAAVNASYVDGFEKAVERLEYDLYYLKYQSLGMDMRIMLKALAHLLFFRGQ